MLIDCCPDIESLLFLQSFLTPLTLTREELLLSPLAILVASALVMESAENRLEDVASSVASYEPGSADDLKLRDVAELDANRPNGSGDNGMTGVGTVFGSFSS
jgi:hypothetical protein